MTRETSPLDAVRTRVAHAARLAGRDATAVTLIAVSKTRTLAAIDALAAQGVTDFGENRVQEAQGKWPGGPHADARLHLIGQLQSNKADDAVALAAAIHSVDRSSLISALGRAMDRHGRRPDCFLQVNLADEPQKGGCAPDDLAGLLKECRAAGVPIVGLMTVPPADLEPAPWFALLNKLARDHGLNQLSMGMSGDFETAIKLGATHIRVGTALFGARGA
jgi:PLP dependent protein